MVTQTFVVFQAQPAVESKPWPLHFLWILLSGHMAIHVDRGSGPRKVMERRGGSEPQRADETAQLDDVHAADRDP